MGATKYLEWIYKLLNGGSVNPPTGPTGSNIAVGSPAFLWTYTGGQTFMPSGTSTAATLPANTDTVLIRAEGGDLYWAINPGGAAASANSAGYVASGQMGFVGPMNGLTGLKLYSAAGAAKAHLEYWDSNG